MINLMNVCSSRFSVCPCPHLPPLSRNDVCDSPLCYHAVMKIKDSLYLIDIIRLWGMTALKLDLRITEFIEIKICFRLKKKYFFFKDIEVTAYTFLGIVCVCLTFRPPLYFDLLIKWNIILREVHRQNHHWSILPSSWWLCL